MSHIDFIQTDNNKLEEHIRKIFKNKNIILDKKNYSVIYKNESCNTMIIYGQTPRILQAKLGAIEQYINFKKHPEDYKMEIDFYKEM